MPAVRPRAPGASNRRRRAVQVLATLSLFTFVGTYVADQVDFLRRHYPGIPPIIYWWPKATQILAPGLGAAALLGLLGFVLHRWRPGK